MAASGSNIIAVWRESSGTALEYSSSSDEGVTWAGVGTLGSGSVELYGVEAEGTDVAILWADNQTGAGGTYDFYVSVSHDFGSTWAAANLLASVPTSSFVQYEASVGVFGGSLVALYQDTTAQWDLYATTSTDWGVSWSAPVLVHSEASPQYEYTQLAWDGSRIVGMWHHADGSSPGDLYAGYSDDAGLSWTFAGEITGDITRSVHRAMLEYTTGGFYAVYIDDNTDTVYYSQSPYGSVWVDNTVGLVAASLYSVASSSEYVFAIETTASNTAVVHRAAVRIPALAITQPQADQPFAAGTTSVDVTVAMADHVTPGHWAWRTGGPFPTAGQAGGTAVPSGETASVDVVDGSSVIYVALVDGAGDLLFPSVTRSVAVTVGDATTPVGGVLLTVASARAAPAATVSVPIETTDPTGLLLRSVSLTLSYDPLMLTPITGNTTLDVLVLDPGEWSVEQNVASAGEWNISMAADPAFAPAAAGTLVTVDFAVSNDALNGDTSAVSLTRADLNEGLVPSASVAGTITVLDVLYGDVSGNGAPTAYDGSWVLEYAADRLAFGPDPGTPFFPIEFTAPVWAVLPVPHHVALLTADVAASGAVTAMDASLILQYDVGLVTTFAADGGGAAPAIAPAGLVAALSGTSSGERPGARVTVTLDASAVADLYAGELALDYDGALLRVADVTLNDGGRRPLLVRRDGDGRVGIAFASARPIATSDKLVEVTFEASRDISRPVESSIRASHLRLNGSMVVTDFVFPFRIEPWQTRLMPNYPNPFNPETWIPFELAEDSEVTVRIYGLAGELVRALDLGALPVGEYVGRGRAAYWDGANEQGERVASGTYVYELAAGEHRALRRMVVMK
jgi:hypothetical protein